MERVLKKIDKVAIFFAVYTLVFLIFFKTLTYTLPFTLAFVFSLILIKPTRFLIIKLKIKRSIASLISTVTFFIFISILLFWGIYHLIQEAVQLAKTIQTYLSTNSALIPNIYDRLYVFYSNLDPSIISTIESNLSSNINKLSNATLNFTTTLLGGIISIFSSIPYVVMVIFFTLISTYYFTKDMSTVKEKIIHMIPSEKNNEIISTVQESKKMLLNYAFSYLIVVFITFLITLTGFSIIRVKYALLLSFLSAIFDILPIVGMGLIYIPIALIFLFYQNYVSAVAIIALYLLANITRQIVEPKIVSTSLGVHPVAILAALFIGVMANGVLGMFFCIFLVIFYNVLHRTGVL
ncbi:pheromone autoinducer 2 transporter [Clostridium homopropionicum DSM 5847]|uniref:Pheromone autoinducer 2 transporter n=1 Tax=Clostridium homopropionicum DSM 5847 TaxID=1121318 RepID=A0A0L6ZCF5_9CLOT|nr:sporulation integral membrane protein YtvI [Clostridium homopropionicum]KOA20632.1 pheromone autoinducer 2 transporter [Clostridium homopropionicum DSM 5847]SFF92713.1 sporulation integral membrane protein YtvI [Clostridium homopropionicum]